MNAIREEARVALGIFQSRSGLSLKQIAQQTGDSYFSMRHLAAGTEHRRNGSAIAERALAFIRTYPPLGHENPGRLYETTTTREIDKLLDYCQAHDVKVIIGEWDSPAAREDREDIAADKLQRYSIDETDPRWAGLAGLGDLEVIPEWRK